MRCEAVSVRESGTQTTVGEMEGNSVLAHPTDTPTTISIPSQKQRQFCSTRSASARVATHAIKQGLTVELVHSTPSLLTIITSLSSSLLPVNSIFFSFIILVKFC